MLRVKTPCALQRLGHSVLYGLLSVLPQRPGHQQPGTEAGPLVVKYAGSSYSPTAQSA